jgi:ATP-dependent Clp protease ATP-binding subunit ClpA
METHSNSNIIDIARKKAQSRNYSEIDSLHILSAILGVKDGKGYRILRTLLGDRLNQLISEVEKKLPNGNFNTEPKQTLVTKSIVSSASSPDSYDLLLSIINHGDNYANKILSSYQVTREAINSISPQTELAE